MRRYPQHYILFVDLFAMGCLLHVRGERCAGHRLVAQVLEAAGEHAEKTYLASLLNNLSGNEMRFADEIAPNLEIRQLYANTPLLEREAACAR